MGEVKNVPKLRFAGFFENWMPTNISRIATKITDGTHDTPKPISKGVPFITAIHVRDGFIDFNNCYFLSEIEHEQIYKRCNPEKGDLLMVNIGSGTATSAQVNVSFEFSLKNVALIKPNVNLIASSFFAQIQRRNSKRLKHQISSGGAQPFLSLSQIGKLKLIVPKTLPEQEKIANFLTAVDAKISNLSEEKSLLEQYKKGAMQKIFSQELRFKQDDGSDFPEWENKRLGEVAKLQGGWAFKSSQFKKMGIPIIRISNISNDHNYINTNSLVYYSEIENDNNFIIKKGDLIIAMSGATTGKSSIYNLKTSAYLNQRVGLFKSKSKHLKYEFLVQYVFSMSFKIDLDSLLVAGAQPNISSKDIESLNFPFPSIDEQTKIANFLTTIDEKIATITEALEGAQAFKKGLLQQLFV